MLDVNALLDLKDIEVEKVDFSNPTPVKGWTGVTDLYVKTFGAQELGAFQTAIRDKDGNGKLGEVDFWRAFYSACDENGKRVFNESHLPKLRERSAEAIYRIAETSRKLEAQQDQQNFTA